ncbi:ABC transporter permease [Plantactinospora sp. KLBMP9567]|uniref:ABC transporter permease n=1 Tax=Plantactinospora sp. KLBMP9567 TaxID=3085900 RepID=UPI0029827F2C|nr:ABC transporter permease [Plantactinospora sp. KLBMP9567]MDW5324425.1 ABC transporter permease [Plantactinospora sp. KLBMP9567]
MSAIAVLARVRPRARRYPPAVPAIAAVVLAGYLVAGLIGPLLISYDPVATSVSDRLLAPGSTTADGTVAVLGTDGVGRDMLGQLVYGARTSIVIGSSVVAICVIVGMMFGTLAGYLSGWTDVGISRLIDVLMAFPGILLAVVIAGLFDRGILVVVLALSVAGWVAFARLARGLTFSLRERPWIDAARLIGVPTPIMIVRHIIPFVIGPVTALATTEFAGAVLSEAGLSFLGLGLPPSAVSWGQVIANGRDYLDTAWWISAFPGLALTGLVVSTGLLGDHLTQRFGARR